MATISSSFRGPHAGKMTFGLTNFSCSPPKELFSEESLIFSRRRADERHIAAFRPRVGARSGISKDFFVPVISPEKSYVKSDLLRRFVSGKVAVNERGAIFLVRSEERRVGKECRSRWS